MPQFAINDVVEASTKIVNDVVVPQIMASLGIMVKDRVDELKPILREELKPVLREELTPILREEITIELTPKLTREITAEFDFLIFLDSFF